MAIVFVPADRAFDRTFGLLGNVEHQTEVLALDRVPHHRFAEDTQRPVGLCDRQQTRGVAVEAMDEARTQRVAGEIGDVRGERVDQGAVARAVGRVRHHPGRLIDHEQFVVFEDDVERNRLRRRDQFLARR